MEEIEIKYQVNSDYLKLSELIKKLGLSLTSSEEQRDEYWDNKNFKIINLKRGLRIRYSASGIKSIQFKSLFKKENGNYFIEELDLLNHGKFDLELLKNILHERLGVIANNKIKSLDSPQKILKSLDLDIAVVFNKKRSTYSDNDKKYLLFVDEVEGLPLHIEIEACDRETLNQVSFEFEKNLDLVKTGQKGYLGILFGNKKGILSEEEFDRRFKKDPKWNLQANELEMYENIFNK